MATKTIRANKSSVWANLGGPNLGGGNDAHLPVSSASGYLMRGGIGFPLPASTWSDVGVLRGTQIRLKTTDQVHVARGTAPQCTVRRITGSWAPNGADDDNPPGPGGDDWSGNGSVYPGPAATSKGEQLIGHSDLNNSILTKSIDAIGLAWAPAEVVDPTGKRGSGAAPYGVMLVPVSGAQCTTEFWSSKVGSGYPELILTYDTKASLAPTAPTLVAPVGPNANTDNLMGEWSATSVTPTTYDAQVSLYPDFAILHWALMDTTTGLTGKSFSLPAGSVVYERETYYYWRARGRNGAQLGPWSAVASFTENPAALPPDPYDSWAGTVLGALAQPRHSTQLGQLWVEGSAVAAVLASEYRERWGVHDVDHPPTIDRIVELIGLGFHVDHDGGWSVTANTHDVG